MSWRRESQKWCQSSLPTPPAPAAAADAAATGAGKDGRGQRRPRLHPVTKHGAPARSRHRRPSF